MNRLTSLLSRKSNKKVLDKNEERISDFTESQQLALLANPDLDSEVKIAQLLKELNELRFLLENKEDELTKTLKRGGPFVFEIGKDHFEIHKNIKVLPDNKIKFKKRTIDIRALEKVGRMKMRASLIQFRAWFVEPEGEYTYDPIDETPIEIKKKNEMQLSLGHATAEAEVGVGLMRDFKFIKKWFEYLPIIFMFLTVFTFLLFMGLFFGQYNLNKA